MGVRIVLRLDVVLFGLVDDVLGEGHRLLHYLFDGILEAVVVVLVRLIDGAILGSSLVEVPVVVLHHARSGLVEFRTDRRKLVPAELGDRLVGAHLGHMEGSWIIRMIHGIKFTHINDRMS